MASDREEGHTSVENEARYPQNPPRSVVDIPIGHLDVRARPALPPSLFAFLFGLVSHRQLELQQHAQRRIQVRPKNPVAGQLPHHVP